MIRGSCARRRCRGWSGLRSWSPSPGRGKRRRHRFRPRAESRESAECLRESARPALTWTWAAARDAAITSFMKSMPDQSPAAATGRESWQHFAGIDRGAVPICGAARSPCGGKVLSCPARREFTLDSELSNVVAYPVPQGRTMSVTLRPDDLVLVTGGSGFLGSAVVRALIARGSRVRALVRSSSPPDNLAGLDCEIVDRRPHRSASPWRPRCAASATCSMSRRTIASGRAILRSSCAPMSRARAA